jgi:hypothetical protein
MADEFVSEKQDKMTENRWAGLAGHAALAQVALAFLSVLLVIISYQFKPSYFVNVGSIGDQPYVAGFNGDEHGSFTYRWTASESRIVLPSAYDGADRTVTIRMSAWRPVGTAAPKVKIISAGQQIASFKVGQEMADYRFSLPAVAAGEGNVEFTLKSPVFSPDGDARKLGVMVDWVRLDPAGGAFGPFSLPPAEILLFALIAAISVQMALIGLIPGTALWFGAAVGFDLLLAVLLAWPRLLVTPYLGWVALALAAGAVVVNAPRLGRWLTSAFSQSKADKASVYVFAGLILALAVFEVVLITNMDYIGHADYADNAVVARNIVLGRGMSVDYVAQFYTPFTANIRHAVDTWPPLQPLLMVPAFLIGGANVVAAKVPNLLLSLALATVVFWAGSRIFDRRAGLAAAGLTAVQPYLVGAVAYPINDLPYTLFVFLFLIFLFMSTEAGRGTWLLEGRLSAGKSRYLGFALTGVWAGLLILAKPTGALIVVASALFALVVLCRRTSLGSAVTRLSVTAGTAFVLVLPWFVRNLLQYHTILYSTESYDAWILKYRTWENIYNIFYGNLPGPGLINGYGFDIVFQTIGDQFTQFLRAFNNGPTFPIVVSLLAIVSVFTMQAKQRRLAWLFALNFAVTAVFVCTYWHYEDRYFLFIIPWLYLFGMSLVFWLHDRLTAEPTTRQGKNWAAGFLVPVVVFVLAWPSVSTVRQDFEVFTSPTAIVGASTWIDSNTPPNAVVMTRNPWEVSFHSERRSVMIPNAEYADIIMTARQYNVTYLQLDHLGDWKMRPALRDLYEGKEVLGFKKVYNSQGILIYRFP